MVKGQIISYVLVPENGVVELDPPEGYEFHSAIPDGTGSVVYTFTKEDE